MAELSHKQRIISNLDIIISFVMLVAGIIVLSFSFSMGIGQYGMGFAFLFGTILYIYFLRSNMLNASNIAFGDISNENNKSKILILNIVFLFFFSISNYLLENVLYVRPPLYFILITVGYYSIFLEIFYINTIGFACYFNILKTVLLSLSFRAGMHYCYPTIPGADVQLHMGFVNATLNNGYLPQEIMDKYSFTPLWHLFVSITGILTDTNPSTMLFLSIIISLTIIMSICIFIIGKSIANIQMGLISVLVINIADMFLQRGGAHTSIESLTSCFLFFILVYSIQVNKKPYFSCLILLSYFLIVLTHQLSTFSCLVIVFGLLMGKIVYNHLLRPIASAQIDTQKLYLNITITQFLYFLSFAIYYWMFTISSQGTSFFDTIVLRLEGTISRMFAEYTAPDSYTTYFTNQSIISNILFNLGYSILVGLAVVGMLLWLNNRHISLIRFSYICSAAILFIVIYPGTILGLGHLLIPHRFISFLEIFLILMAAYSICIVCNHYTKSWGALLANIVVVMLIFFMSTAPYINRNDTIYCNEQRSRTGCTYSEIGLLSWAIDYSGNKTIYRDPLFDISKIFTVTPLSQKDIEIYKENGLNIENDIGLVIVTPYFEQTGGVTTISYTFGITRVHNCSIFLNNAIKSSNLIFSTGTSRIYNS